MIDFINLKDGDDLGDGVVYSNKGGYHVGAYRCKCGREQTAKNDFFSGGILPETANQIGWIYTDAGWSCPFCDGDEEKLKAVFNRGET